jgi:hypothetical protein
MKSLQIFLIPIFFASCLCQASNIINYGNDDQAREQLSNLCSEWMEENKYYNLEIAKLFIATYINIPGRNYPYIYTLEALRNGANPYLILDINNQSPFMIAIEQKRSDIYDLLLSYEQSKIW